MGLLQKSTSGFGVLSVSGRKRVPYPPTRIRAFIAPAGDRSGSLAPKHPQAARPTPAAHSRRRALPRVLRQPD
ncbi:hypothetical protein I79_006646 [Cricetulus griseus]|uniref:Uncharacterized protein n=1 Tax=Cricetulus griseus TaxID=10029 RepID=G3H8E6_CRIGR|nr:hypothetical protein I79_006646 [Cricetulus griseus]